MATLQELQMKLDDKSFDPSKLTKEQEAAVNLAFESGELKGYKDVNEIRKEKKIGSQLIAQEKTEKAQPFTTATKGLTPSGEGFERRDFELAGDVTAGFATYLKEAPKVASALTRGEFGINKAAAMAMDTNKMTNFMANLPYVKNIKLMRNTARALGRVMDGFRLVGVQPIARTGGALGQVAQTEVKALTASSLGAGGGSIAYDIANLSTDFKNAAFNDLSEVSENDINKLSFPNQMLVHSLEAMKNSLYFNTAGSAAIPVLGTMMRGLKGPLGIGSKETKQMVEDAARKGIPMDMSSAASNKGLFGRFVNTFWSTIGVFPTVSFFKKRQRQVVQQKAISAWLEEVTAAAPVEMQSFLSMKFLNQFKNNYKAGQDQIKVNYAHVFDIAQELGNPQIIPTQALKEKTRGFLDLMQTQYPLEMAQAQSLAKQGTTEFGDPLVELISVLKNLPDTITPTQYQGIIKSIWKGANSSKLESFQDTFFNMMNAAKEDFWKVGNKDNLQSYLGSAAFKNSYDEVLRTSGKEAADAYAKKMTLGLDNFHMELTNANKFFSEITQPFNGGIANQIKNTDANIFATKGILNVSKEGRIPVTQMWEKTIKNFYKYGDVSTLEDFKLVVGADKPGVGQQLFNRGRALYLWEAMLKGFKSNPGVPTTGFFKEMEKARRMGVLNLKNSDDLYEMTGTKLRQELKAIDPEKANNYGVGTVEQRDILSSVKDAGSFDVQAFKEALGYKSPADRPALLDKFTAMYGGGKTGREAGENLLKLVDILDKEFSTKIADVSTFMSRRFVLGGLGALGTLGGVGLAAGLPGIVAFGLFAGGGGYLLSNPKTLKYMLDVYSDFERMERGELKTQANFPKSLIRLLNYTFQEEKDFPRVNPNKINAEELTNYLYNKNILIPQLGFDPDVLRRDIKDRMYPELKQIDKGTDMDAIKGTNFLNGSALGTLKANKVIDAQPQTNQQQVQPNNVMQAPAAVSPQTNNMQMNRAQMVQSLFPNDAYSQAIAQNQMNQGQQ
jgi:hypothetical protein